MKATIIVSLFVIGALALNPLFNNDFDRHIRYTRTGVPPKSDWRILKEADDLHAVTFTLALKQQNLEKLDALFWDNSNPNSPNFAKHMTRKQVKDLVSAPTEVRKQIIDWIYTSAAELGSGHILNIEDRGDAIVVKATVALVEKLFHTKMYLYYNARKNWVVAKHFGTLSVPLAFSEQIEMVTGITELPPGKLPFVWDNDEYQEKMAAKRQNADNQCNVPYTIKNQYNVPQTLTITNKNSNISIYAEDSIGNPEGFGFLDDLYWETANGLPRNPITCLLGNGVSNYVQNDTDLEGQLDTQMVTGMAPGIPTCFWIMDGGNGWMYEFASVMFATEGAPLVVSMSYGWVEFEQCINETDGTWFLGNCSYLHIPDSATYVNRTNVEFKKLGLLGHTLLAASGDDGTCGTHGSPNGCTALGPIFPAASPYVLTVGATSIEPSSSNVDHPAGGQPPICTNSNYGCTCTTSQNEQVCLQNNTGGFDTGGGFSYFSPQPAYQKNAVTAYIKSGVQLPDQKYMWSPNNRGFPDIAAIGENVCVLNDDQPCSPVGGTSASCPLIASLITLLNQDRLNAGKTPLGFVNQIIYDMFDKDSTKYFYNGFETGNNGGECGDFFGFNAKAGHWTPLTGVGSPKFDMIREYVASLP